MEVASGRKQLLLAGFAISGYDILRDEQQVVFTRSSPGIAPAWLPVQARRWPPTSRASVRPASLWFLCHFHTQRFKYRNKTG
jgi:hypothetical protein